MLVHLLQKSCFHLFSAALLRTSRCRFFVKHDNLITEELCNIIYNEAYFTFMACLCFVSPRTMTVTPEINWEQTVANKCSGRPLGISVRFVVACDSPWQQQRSIERTQFNSIDTWRVSKCKKTLKRRRNDTNLLTIIQPGPFFRRLQFLCTFLYANQTIYSCWEPEINIEADCTIDSDTKGILLPYNSNAEAFRPPKWNISRSYPSVWKTNPASPFVNGKFIGGKYLWPRLSSLKVPRSLPCIKCPNIFLPFTSPGILLRCEY